MKISAYNILLRVLALVSTLFEHQLCLHFNVSPEDKYLPMNKFIKKERKTNSMSNVNV